MLLFLRCLTCVLSVYNGRWTVHGGGKDPVFTILNDKLLFEGGGLKIQCDVMPETMDTFSCKNFKIKSLPLRFDLKYAKEYHKITRAGLNFTVDHCDSDLEINWRSPSYNGSVTLNKVQ